MLPPPFNDSVVPAGTPLPVTLVVSASGPPTMEVATPGGVLMKLTWLPPLAGVLNAKVARPIDGVGMLTTPVRPRPAFGVLKIILVLLATFVVSKVGGGVAGVLANWIVLKPGTVLLVAVNDWSSAKSLKV